VLGSVTSTAARATHHSDVHNPNLCAQWPEFYNTENNAHIVIGKENYFLSGDGFLMPTKKDQAPPDLRYGIPTRGCHSSALQSPFR
jgi:hypothetical protein